MITSKQAAQNGHITDSMKAAAAKEGCPAETIRKGIADGSIVVCANPRHSNLHPCAIGKGVSTKTNANIGTSGDNPDLKAELHKLKTAIAAGADAVMDLSIGSGLAASRQAILAGSTACVGTVPIYEAAALATERHGSIYAMDKAGLFAVIKKQAQDGVDFMTIHAGINTNTLATLKNSPRIMNVVSRGGGLLLAWMLHHHAENPFYEFFDELLDLLATYDITLSLGDGLRPGCLNDATDAAQISELITLGELTQRAWNKGVQVMIEGPGHIPVNHIETNVKLAKNLCHGAPFYVLGPLVTDIAPGYDHITAAIGGALAGAAGADFLCYVTPAEHLGLPSAEDVHEGVIAARIAAHAADLAKGLPSAAQWDKEMALARQKLDWQKQIALAIDPLKAERYRKAKNPATAETCSMCGRYCPLALLDKQLAKQ